MKMTSNAKRTTYIDNIASGKITTNTLMVLHYIKNNCNVTICDTHEIRAILKMPHQSVTAVISNLMDLGMIKITGEVKRGNQTYSAYAYVSDRMEQQDLEYQRKAEKYHLWLKQGMKEYTELMTDEMVKELSRNLHHVVNPFYEL